MKRKLRKSCLIGMTACVLSNPAIANDMDSLWGDSVVKLRAADAKRGQLFDVGNYAMFIHWGLYSQLGNKVDGKTYYGIGEWIMNPRMAGIPVPVYKDLAKTFNPTKFDPKAIVQLARDSGMKYIVITSKHHDGFAMFDSDADDFNVVDATPYEKDPMKELADACREAGIGFGFYYSHNQDWTYPGGGRGPTEDAEGNPATFDVYFEKKCRPQIEEITTKYGPIEIVWFDTPGDMPKHYVQELCDIVHKNQPNALVSGRAGHSLGDYQTLGDMEVPIQNVEGMWESVDTTNDSWAYAYYDENWKTPKAILHRLLACVARGGTYMLNIGPRGDGSVPQHAADSLRKAGEWIHRYPQVVYGTGPSPWKHALPWGDAITMDNKLYLTVEKWPSTDELYLPGLKTKIISAKILNGTESAPVAFEKSDIWTKFTLPSKAPEKLVSIIELELEGPAEADATFALDPVVDTHIEVEFAEVKGNVKSRHRWMEKFGEWRVTKRVNEWTPDTVVTFEVDVLEPGVYAVSLNYSGKGRLVWGVGVEGGEFIQNQQNSSHNYAEFPIGWLNFETAGRHKVNVTFLKGNAEAASLRAISFKNIQRQF